MRSSSLDKSSPCNPASIDFALNEGLWISAIDKPICWPKPGPLIRSAASRMGARKLVRVWSEVSQRISISGRKYSGRQVAIAAVADDRNDDGMVELGAESERDVQRAAG